MSVENLNANARTRATLIGFGAVLMWSFLAVLSTASGSIPPFQLTAMCFFIGSLTGMASWLWRPHAIQSLRQNWRVWVVGTLGLCIYHVLYFLAIQNAPPVEASLIAYLWPLLIVLFSAFLPGERLALHHVIGAVLGLAGAVLIITRGGALGLSDGLQLGHIFALLCAFTWAAYSLASRRQGRVPTDVVIGFSMLTAMITAVLHFTVEETVWLILPSQWLAILLLGIFPLGIGFYLWDIGVKKGDIMVLGAASYAAPLLSTLIMLVAGFAVFHWTIAVACLLITAGAFIAAKDMFWKK